MRCLQTRNASDKLTEFPTKSVRLKRPFAIQPWTDSEENIGNLFMVRRTNFFCVLYPISVSLYRRVFCRNEKCFWFLNIHASMLLFL